MTIRKVPTFEPRNIPTEPVVSTMFSVLDFFDLFTEIEQIAIFEARKTVVSVDIFFEKMKLVQELDLTDPRTIAGVESMEAGGLIGVGRAAEILATTVIK